jgi:hypothetical protein
LAFNFLSVKFTDNSFEAGTQPYESPEQLDALRARLANTHSVIRLRSQIVCVPVAPDAETVGESTTFDTRGPNLALTAYLLQAALTRVLTEGWNFSLRKFDPLTFVSRLPNRDLMQKALKDRPAIEGLHVYPEYELDVRRSGPMGYPGIIVGLRSCTFRAIRNRGSMTCRRDRCFTASHRPRLRRNRHHRPSPAHQWFPSSVATHREPNRCRGDRHQHGPPGTDTPRWRGCRHDQDCRPAHQPNGIAATPNAVAVTTATTDSMDQRPAILGPCSTRGNRRTM